MPEMPQSIQKSTSRRRSGYSRRSRTSFFSVPQVFSWETPPKSPPPRRIWARWMRDRYHATDERSLKLRFHTQTAGVSLTAQQPDNNVGRTAIEALAAVLGGTQSLPP